jgi:hypothetical protein
MIALRTFDEMPCGLGLSTKAVWLFSKTHSIVVSYRPQVTPGPARTHAACVSLSLFTMSISSGAKTPEPKPNQRRKNSRIPLSGHPADMPACRTAAQKKPQRINAPQPLSDPAYMGTWCLVSSSLLKKFPRGVKPRAPRDNSCGYSRGHTPGKR